MLRLSSVVGSRVTPIEHSSCANEGQERPIPRYGEGGFNFVRTSGPIELQTLQLSSVLYLIDRDLIVIVHVMFSNVFYSHRVDTVRKRTWSTTMHHQISFRGWLVCRKLHAYINFDMWVCLIGKRAQRRIHETTCDSTRNDLA